MTKLAKPRRSGWLLVLWFAILTIVVGGIAGAIWLRMVQLPSYQVSSSGRASTTERALAGFFGTDAWYVILAVLAGATIGVIAWRWFSQTGPLVVLAGVSGPLVAGLVCLLVASVFGASDFDVRLGKANPGDWVAIDFQLRSWSALIVWPMFGVLPILIASLFSRDSTLTLRRQSGNRGRPPTADLGELVPGSDDAASAK